MLTRRHILAGGLTTAAAFAPSAAFAQRSAANSFRARFGAHRAARRTDVHYQSESRHPLAPPATGVFDLVHFPSAVGACGAYLTPNPGDGGRHPAIIWLTGGETNTLDDVWSPRPRDDDQSAAAYRQAGVPMMFPSLRGGNDNPGELEGFYGEIDDVMAAADWLAARPWIDPTRIYLGGHSTGGSLAVLCAEASDKFRATFAFGAVASVMRDYGPDFVAVDVASLPSAIDEALDRAPGYWLPSVQRKLFIIEGTTESNIDSLRQMRARDAQDGHNPNITFVEVPGASHFSVLAPANEVIAQQILRDAGATTNITLTGAQLRRGHH